MAHEMEAVAFERERAGVRAAVVDDDTARIDCAAALIGRSPATRFGENFGAVVNEIIQRRVDLRNGFRRRALFEDLIHLPSPSREPCL